MTDYLHVVRVHSSITAYHVHFAVYIAYTKEAHRAGDLTYLCMVGTSQEATVCPFGGVKSRRREDDDSTRVGETPFK